MDMKSPLEHRLEILKKKALGFGADDAKLISADRIRIEDEVLEMCKKPFCDGFGKSANCPPHTMTPARFREFIKQYTYAIVFKIDVPVEDMMSEKRNTAFRKIYEIASNLETEAKSSGFELSRGYAAGSCKPVFCKEHKVCQALIDKTCRNSFLARPSMEAVGMNVMKIIQEAGWEIKPIHSDSNPASFTKIVLSGLVLLG